MSYTPTAAGSAVASKIAANLDAAAGNTQKTDSITAGNIAPAAMADALISTLGLVGQSDAAAFGTTATSSTSFSDVGNGSTTGFSSWTVAVPASKQYILRVRSSAYCTTAGGQIFFQVLVDGSAPAGQPASAQRFYYNTINQQNVFVFDVLLTLTAGSHTFKLQWRVNSPVVGQVDVNDGRTFTLIGC